MARTAQPRWLLLMHQIPPHPAYLRVKIGRRLSDLGAVAVKNSIYVLPRGADTREDFQWVRREIVAGGGETSVCEARFVDGLSDEAVETLFRDARAADYASLLQEARRLQGVLARPGKRGPEARGRVATALARLRKRQAELEAIDFFKASGRDALAGMLGALDAALRPEAPQSEEVPLSPAEFRGRTWVTRADLHVDRLASAWLIRRFVDPKARFRFTASGGRKRVSGELAFDMFEADFTHEGDRCTFEVLVRRFGLSGEAALQDIGEIVHDIDLKDAKFARSEASGIDRLLAGLARRHKDDGARLQEGLAVFDALYASFQKK